VFGGDPGGDAAGSHKVRGSFVTSIVSGLSARQIAGLPVSVLSKFTRADIAAMSTSQVAGLTAPQLNSLSAANLQSFAVAQLNAISYSTFLALTSVQTANLSPSQIGALSGAQVSAMTLSQLNGLSKADLQALNVSYLTKSQIAGLNARSIGNLSAAQITTLIGSRPGVLSASQIGQLNNEQFDNLNTPTLQAIDFTALTASQISWLSTSTIARLSSAQVVKLSATQTGALSASQLNAMTTSQISSFSKAGTQGLSASQLDGMSRTNLNAVNVANLSATTVSSLTTNTLTSLTAGQTASLLANQADKLSVAQISNFSATQLATTTLVGAAGGLQFNLSWAASAANAPAGYRNAAIAAAAGLSADFSTKAVVNLQIGYGEVAGGAIPANAAAESGSYTTTVSYSALRAALQKNAGNSAIQATAAASLSQTNPTNGTLKISVAEAKALGLVASSTPVDGYVSLSSAVPFEYNQTAASGKYDAVGTFQHEMTEVMGRTGSVGAAFGNGIYTALDLYRYTSTNNANPAQGQPVRALSQQSGNVAYFSIDGGKTNLGGYNPSNGGADYADWNATMVNDPFGFASAGVVQRMSGNDVVEMAAIGWNMTSQGVTAAQAAATYALV